MCIHFPAGRCRYGDKCKFYHDISKVGEQKTGQEIQRSKRNKNLEDNGKEQPSLSTIRNLYNELIKQGVPLEQLNTSGVEMVV